MSSAKKISFFSKDRIWYVIPKSTSQIGIFSAKLGIIALIATVFFGVISVTSSSTSFSATISIKDWKGRYDKKINESNSTIRILDIAEKGFTTGIVEFSKIPSGYKGKAVKVEFFPCGDCKGWELVNNMIVLEENPKISELRIRIKGLEQIYGTITDIKGNPLDSVKVEIVGTPLYEYTKDGKYKIDIPIGQQEYQQEIRASKPNFKDDNKSLYLENNKNTIDFTLKRYE